jgi:uncharacterized protein
MASFEDASFLLNGFTGRVRLFPLPSLVMFPHVLQPLHVFEPRYRELLEEALADDKLIAMAMLTPGWEDEYEGRPPTYPVACLGQIVSHHRLEDGSYNVLLLGVQRVRVVKELAPAKSFREADVELCDDYYPTEEAAMRPFLQEKLRNALMETLPLLPQAKEQIDQIMAADVSLGVLADIVGYMLDIDPAEKEDLLAELNVHRRTELLLEHLAAAKAGHGGETDAAGRFPPRFSSN